MGRNWLLGALAMCDRHIVASDLILAAQQNRIAVGEAVGRNMCDSRSLMSTLRETHRLHVEHRASLVRQLDAL